MDYRKYNDEWLLLKSHQNPNSAAPAHIIDAQRIHTVRHYGFKGVVSEGVIVVHEEALSDVSDFFTLAYELNFPIEKVIPISDDRYGWNDNLSMSDNNTSGFNYRTIMGTERLSNHATGFAFDVNPKQNIYVRHDMELGEMFSYPEGASYDESEKGTLTKNHLLVKFMKEKGWVWGGDWELEKDGVVDYQHFEKAVRV